MRGVLAIVRRDLLLACRHPGEVLNPLIFFLMAVTLVPLGLTPEASKLAAIAPGIVWVMALLSSLLSLDGLFYSDYQDGSLEQLMLSADPLYLLVVGKVLVHWLVAGLPLVLMSPLLGMMLSLPAAGYWPLVASLLIGTAILSLLGGIGAALTVGLRKGGLLLSLIIMPLYLPVLIFGANTVQRAVEGFSPAGSLAMMGAMLALALLLAPFAIAGALRISVHG